MIPGHPILAQSQRGKNHRVVLASNNKGKLREFSDLLGGLHLDIIPQAQLGVNDADETGLTFVENAIIKARHAARISGLPAIADDSGIEVDALKGVPGIYSARYAGMGASDAANNAKLLQAMVDVPEAQRSARYQCLIVYMRHALDPTPVICSGSWEGRILTEPRGSGGFGYDPLFFVPTHHCSGGELDAAEKNRISHRGQALRKLLDALRVLEEN
ncbi:MAG: RdgB/HAM1 family non-canonical purine NTP pyrophosphatase [Gammaproteobacteria bacterium]|nr:RdgB/HAM1 family non-canonical purine NTP pyrophosphatase [Gammaproteobacteria bacterium]